MHETLEDNRLDSTIFGKYKDIDVYLIKKEGVYYISFDSDDNQHYWIEALQGMYRKDPTAKFLVKVKGKEIQIDMINLFPLIQEMTRFINLQ